MVVREEGSQLGQPAGDTSLNPQRGLLPEPSLIHASPSHTKPHWKGDQRVSERNQSIPGQVSHLYGQETRHRSPQNMQPLVSLDLG